MRKKWTSFILLATVGSVCSVGTAQDYGDRGDDDATFSDSVASVNISGFAGGDWDVLNSGGHAEVLKSDLNDPEYVDIGEIEVDEGTFDTVEAAWWEVILPDGHFVQLVLRTVSGTGFVPFNSHSNGDRITAFTYELGGDGNGLDFRPWVDSIKWRELQVSYSADGGQNVFSDPTIFDPIGNAEWDGTDDHHLGLAFPGDGINWIQATYLIEPVPAPATLAVLLVPGGLLLGRRRR